MFLIKLFFLYGQKIKTKIKLSCERKEITLNITLTKKH